MRAQAASERQGAEVLVERDQETTLARRTCDDLFIARAWGVGSYPSHVVPPRAESLDSLAREVLIGKNSHSPSGIGNIPLGLERVTRIGQARQDVLPGDAWVVLKDLCFCPALRQQLDDKFNRQTSSLHNGLPAQNAGVDDDAILPAHSQSSRSLLLSHCNTVRRHRGDRGKVARALHFILLPSYFTRYSGRSYSKRNAGLKPGTTFDLYSGGLSLVHANQRISGPRRAAPEKTQGDRRSGLRALPAQVGVHSQLAPDPCRVLVARGGATG